MRIACACAINAAAVAAMKLIIMYDTANSNELPETYIKLRRSAFRPRTDLLKYTHAININTYSDNPFNFEIGCGFSGFPAPAR